MMERNLLPRARMRTRTILTASLFVLGIIGCGQIADVPDQSNPSSDAATTSSDGDAGGVTTSDDADVSRDASTDVSVKKVSAGHCAKDDDCDAGGKCVELAPGGYRVCSYPPPKPQVCTNPSNQDECCGTCAVGTCTLQTSCGGAFIDPHNVCAVSECTTNAECGPKGICLPTGVGNPYTRTCMKGSNECIAHSDCNAAPDGVCALVGTVGPIGQCAPWSCPGTATQVANGLACIYGSECASDEDCAKTGGHCEKVGGRPVCRPGVRGLCPPPP